MDKNINTFLEGFDSVRSQAVTKHAEYIALLKELDSYSGKNLDKETVDTLNILLNKIQNTFNELHPIFNFIVENYDVVKNAIETHNNFLQHIKDINEKIAKEKEEISSKEEVSDK